MNIEKANLDLCLDIVNGVVALNLKRECLSIQSFVENIHILLSFSSKRTEKEKD